MRAALRISLIYLVVSALWITLSDKVVFVLLNGADPHVHQQAQSLKGGVFVVVTAVGLFILTARVITRQERVADALESSEARFRMLLADNPQPMLVYDPVTLRFIEVNQAAQRKYGYTRDEFLKLRISDLRPLDDVPLVLERERHTGQQATDLGIWRHRLKDGTDIEMQMLVYPVTFRRERAALVMPVDITEIQRIQAERVENERLRLELNKEAEMRHLRHQFTDMISHQFRAPLATISNSAETLETYFDRLSPEQRAAYFQRIRDKTDLLIVLVKDILDAQQFQRALLVCHPEADDLLARCTQVVDECAQNDRGAHRVTLTSDLTRAPGEFDHRLIYHVLSNLLTNACKYSPAGTTVDVCLSQEGDHYVVSVRDEGIGIPPDALKRVFDMYYRAENVSSVPGSGLGLSIARQALELHGGTLDVESAVGAGSTFTLHLPRALSPAAASVPV